MARTTRLDYDTWYSFSPPRRGGGGSDLDQGEHAAATSRCRREPVRAGRLAHPPRPHSQISAFAGTSFGAPIESNGRIGNYYNRATAAQLGLEPDFTCPLAAVLREDFNPARWVVISPGSRVSYARSTNRLTLDFKVDYNNFAPRTDSLAAAAAQDW